jgi:uncharacterized protein YbcC (UPF0753/DUF2309 family)
MKYDTSHLPAGAAAVADPAVAAATVAAERACRRIAPLFPLQGFVAVNPFLGIAEKPLEDAAALMARVAGARLTMPRAFYREALASGRLTVDDIREALAASSGGASAPAEAETIVAALKASGPEAEAPAPLPTVAGVAAATTGRDWEGFVTERLSAFAADAFDAGQASWPAPWRDRGLLAAWRAAARVDRTPEIAGITGFRSVVAALPDRAEDLLAAAAARLGLPDAALPDYFHRLLMTIGGWAGHARWRLWQAELAGGTDRTLVEFLAVRAAFDVGLYEAFRSRPGFASAWESARAGFEAAPGPRPATAATLTTDAVLQLALERAWQRDLFQQLAADPAAPPARPVRPAVQAVFCIDVRSEVFRRALESTTPEVETGGFAGFFGVPAAVVPFGETTASARCPVLLRPSLLVCEEPAGPAGADGPRQRQQRLARLAAAKIWRTSWQAFRTAAVSAFTFVETAGLAYAGRLLARTLPAPRPPERVKTGGGKAATALALQTAEAAPLAVTARVDLAEGVLRAMSMTSGFARLVLLAGHGATTANNPYAHGLDCGACGGQSGEVSARVAAALFNDPAVREGLRARGIDIPADTLFVAGLHDTTTDTVTLYAAESAGHSHRGDLARLSGWLALAGRRARAERAALLGIAPGRAVDAAVAARSTDWSQVRPEWGLARCAAFIAAPRERTLGRGLDGRVFLHSYDWRADRDFATLKLILTAPVIVASWINLQYYASSVDNRVFGSGNKVLHNVVGTIGVLEGTGGDLRTGLPLQSVHDGAGLVHEPLRLTVLVEAPVEAINAVIEAHEGLRDLVDNGWLHLLALNADGAVAHRYVGGLAWEAEPPVPVAPAVQTGVAA